MQLELFVACERLALNCFQEVHSSICTQVYFAAMRLDFFHALIFRSFSAHCSFNTIFAIFSGFLKVLSEKLVEFLAFDSLYQFYELNETWFKENCYRSIKTSGIVNKNSIRSAIRKIGLFLSSKRHFSDDTGFRPSTFLPSTKIEYHRFKIFFNLS